LEVAFELPNSVTFNGEKISSVSGMGIPGGITLITGGGYHGKSTLLDAIELGIYNHIPSDGREYVITNPDAVKVRAEDGRRVEKVDISPFIDNLPNEQNTEAFYSDNASGSTSQASNIMEMIELGAEALLVDEDTSATNFMIRDARMQALVKKENEPITPFLDRVRELYEDYGISTILVMGGSGDYFDVADNIIMMRNFLPHDVGEQAREIAGDIEVHRQKDTVEPFQLPAKRIPLTSSLEKAKGRKNHIRVNPRGLYKIQFGREDIEMRFVEQLVDHSQTNSVGQALRYAMEEVVDDKRSLNEILDEVEGRIEEEGLDFLCPFDDEHPGKFAKVRKYEIAAALNRLRVFEVDQEAYEVEEI
jgi:predicted ABC-class ATPase